MFGGDDQAAKIYHIDLFTKHKNARVQINTMGDCTEQDYVDA